MGKSTGPRTQRGKARSSQNAAKHWIESGRILPDEQEEAAILRSGLEEDFRPDGLIEHEIIDDLVLNRLHKRRVDVAMTREFSREPSKKRLSSPQTKIKSGAVARSLAPPGECAGQAFGPNR